MTFYKGLSMDSIRIALADDGRPLVYWEAKDSGPVHLHVDPEPALLVLIKDLRRQCPAGHLAEFDAACRDRGLEPATWPAETGPTHA